MITGLTIRRFQSFEDQHFEFGGLTVIVGPSNSGKSALGRAMRVVTRNAFSSGFVRVGHKDSEVTLHLGDTAVTALRGPALSTFSVEHTGAQPDVYAKAGTSVPEPIEALLQTPSGPHELFYTTQFDAPFLLSATGSAAAAVLGELSSATLLSSAVKEAARRRGAAAADAKFQTSAAADGEVQVRALYSTLPARREALHAAQAARETLTGVLSEVEVLSGLLLSIQTLTGSISASSASYAPRARALSDATGAVRDLLTLAETARAVDVSAAEVRRLGSEVSGFAQVDARAQALSEVSGLFSGLSDSASAGLELAPVLAGLSGAQGRASDLEASVTTLTEAVSQAQGALDTAFAEVGVCPLCSQVLSAGTTHTQEQA